MRFYSAQQTTAAGQSPVPFRAAPLRDCCLVVAVAVVVVAVSVIAKAWQSKELFYSMRTKDCEKAMLLQLLSNTSVSQSVCLSLSPLSLSLICVVLFLFLCLYFSFVSSVAGLLSPFLLLSQCTFFLINYVYLLSNISVFAALVL